MVNAGDPRRIVVLKPCCLGDLVQMTAVLAALRVRWPEAAISIGAGCWSLPAVAHHPALAGSFDLGAAGVRGRQRPADLLHLQRRLRAGRFDLAVVPDRSPVLALAAFLAGIPRRAGLDSGGRGRLYTTRVAPLPRAHELDQAARLLAALGAGPLPLPRFFPGAGGAAAAERLLTELGGGPLALLAPGGGDNPGTRMPSKRWSAAGFAAVAAALRDSGATVAAVGSAGDREAIAAVGALAPALVDLSGGTSIDALGALLGRAAVYVGNDSGTSHLAAASGCPTVAVFGPTAPELYAPRGRRVRLFSPPAGLRIGGSGTVRDPYRYAEPWQGAIPAGAVAAASLDLSS